MKISNGEENYNSMTNQDKIAFIRQKAIEANKFIAYRPFKDVRLADVLLAIKETAEPYALSALLLVRQEGQPEAWNLREDNLEDQTPETIDFIYSLLK